jgi:hypothetical protein
MSYNIVILIIELAKHTKCSPINFVPQDISKTTELFSLSSARSGNFFLALFLRKP